jgi:hypothetical protein
LPDAGEREALRLLDTLGIPASSLLSGAYIDLLERAAGPRLDCGLRFSTLWVQDTKQI